MIAHLDATHCTGPFQPGQNARAALSCQCLPGYDGSDALRCQWQLLEPHANGPRQGIGNGWCCGHQSTLADTLGAEGAGAITVLDQNTAELSGQVFHSRN